MCVAIYIRTLDVDNGYIRVQCGYDDHILATIWINDPLNFRIYSFQGRMRQFDS